MIKQYCDVCKNETERLNSLYLSIGVPSAFRKQSGREINKDICEVCELFLLNILKKYAGK